MCKRSSSPLGDALRSAKWDLAERPRVVLSPEAVYRASTFPSQDELGAQQGPLVALPQDRRFLYPNLPPGPPLGDDLVIRDYKQTGSRVVTVSVERSPTSTADKATMEVSIDLASDLTKQLAVVVEDIPNAVIASVPAFNTWLDSEMRFIIDPGPWACSPRSM